MTHYATCINCAVDAVSCQRRQNLRAALKGSGVYSLKFKCAERQQMFSAGQRVEFDWSLWERDEYDSSELPMVFHGTVIRERGAKFVVQVDSGKDASGEGIEASEVFKKNDQLLIKVRPAKMRALDEAPRAVCSTCYHVEGGEDRCYQNGTDWMPNGCIRPAFHKNEESDHDQF
ncbi:hypothetical protein EVC10_039 [Rhizobium phage RHph_Y25]|uniref:hypothetical protein n=1 Tax=Rhizobium TaxID=379 RepID=UPI0007E936A9|nr:MULTISPECIES: hypothetical protein [Rhizobium]QIG73733.1 hypothetical protein EVC05_041 [Rhizobium phage RHph_N2]QIG74547.1 hypothetical protein EVC10_039 [Rhizobium phage RHph_Y25]QXV74451.1 hypothetical protein [Rhizobium phage RHEph18]ANL02649.1 hypothetical protein AMJ99_CH01062 [Rhizobium esperanzae]ANM33501.1 hypothetical protein AMK04_CH01063 [Rhizobium sp. N871]